MPPDPLSTTFAALADPTRRAILARLAAGQASVTELAQPFDITLPAITKHLKVLERAGLVARSREAQWRPCRLQPQPLREVADWVQPYRVMWEQRFDQLEEYLRDLQAQESTVSAAATSHPRTTAPHQEKSHAARKK
ncbi:ArsR/SmtB family transcription factor [Rhodanobacter koreensis]